MSVLTPKREMVLGQVIQDFLEFDGAEILTEPSAQREARRRIDWLAASGKIVSRSIARRATGCATSARGEP